MTPLALASASSSPLELQRFCVKFFACSPTKVDDSKLIDVFQRWIQRQILPGTLIDVADYRHIHNGPGTLLISHEANLFMDRADNRLGLLYQRKVPQPGTLAQRMLAGIKVALTACRLLEQELLLGGDIKFSGDEFVFVANDRLLAPNDTSTFAALRGDLEAVAEALWPGGGSQIQHYGDDTRERFTVQFSGAIPSDIETLLENQRH